MRHLNLTCPTPQQNLAFDEAWLDACEEGRREEVVRFWEPFQYFVVVGYANQVRMEVNLEACQKQNIPILRRCSGGGAVVQGPGCLNYSLMLRIQESGPLANVTETNAFIMERHRAALERVVGAPVKVQGFTDLTLGNLKFSGNAQRRKRRFLLFHGSFLLRFDIALIEELLRVPSKQPSYREDRSHQRFLTNLHCSPDQIKEVLRKAWSATEILDQASEEKTDRLDCEKYSRDEWNFKF